MPTNDFNNPPDPPDMSTSPPLVPSLSGGGQPRVRRARRKKRRGDAGEVRAVADDMSAAIESEGSQLVRSNVSLATVEELRKENERLVSSLKEAERQRDDTM